jgi:hypothetical protein
MSNRSILSDELTAEWELATQRVLQGTGEPDTTFDPNLPLAITKAASQQTYYTIRFLVDHERVPDAYRAYAYFRWVDDWLDREVTAQLERCAFIVRQQALIECAYRSECLGDLSAEERMLVDLVRTDPQQNSGLHAYIRNLMAVMAFDADRRGRLISQAELSEYTRWLATGVTEAMHYFIGHDDPSPQGAARYFAVTGAHITHMLRDTFEDTAAGYYNIPYEFLRGYGIMAEDVESDAYRQWVKSRVQLARSCFEAGKSYLRQVKNLRCRLAGFAYTARFEGVLAAIEREDYRLRPEYSERKSLGGALRMAWAIFTDSLKL